MERFLPSDQSLFAAVYRGDADRVRYLLRCGTTVEGYHDIVGQGLFEFAVRLNRPVIVALLLTGLRDNYPLDEAIEVAVGLTVKQHQAALDMKPKPCWTDEMVPFYGQYAVNTDEVVELLLAKPVRTQGPYGRPSYRRPYISGNLSERLAEKAIVAGRTGVLRMLCGARCRPARHSIIDTFLDTIQRYMYMSDEDWGAYRRNALEMLRVLLEQRATLFARFTMEGEQTILHKLLRIRGTDRKRTKYMALLDEIAEELVGHGAPLHHKVPVKGKDTSVLQTFCWHGTPDQPLAVHAAAYGCRHGRYPKWMLDREPWSPATHRQTFRTRRRAIHTVMVLWHNQITAFAPLAVELLFVVFEQLCT